MADRSTDIARQAREKCEGCRLSWRLRGWRHGEPIPMECRAKSERQQLRDIAQQAFVVLAFPPTEDNRG